MQTGGGRGTAPVRWTRVPAPGREGRGPVGEDFPRTGRGPGGAGRGGSGPVDPDRFFSKPPAVVGEDERTRTTGTRYDTTDKTLPSAA